MAAVTPDFYEYRHVPLADAALEDGFVTVRWHDGASLRAHALWLAENTVGLGLDPRTRESTIDPGDLPSATSLRSVAVAADGSLSLSWVLDGVELHTSSHPGWLRHVADGLHLPDAALPAQQMWTAASLAQPPSLDGSGALGDQSVMQEWLTLLVRYGLARLRGTPFTVDHLRELALTIGPIRSSNFGEIFDVRADIDPASTANTGLDLGQHTDLPTRETPPGFQFLHCVRNSVPGGSSRMTDGLAVVTELRDRYPDDFEALTTLRWVFDNRSASEDHRWSAPIIDHVDDGLPLTIRAFYPVRGFPDMPADDVPRAYAAMRTFSEVARHPRFQITTAFVPGDLVGFDNRRILHGRDAFEPGGGQRHLRGCYVDHDDLYSRLRVLNRRSQAT